MGHHARVPAIDVLRGCALLGILVMNVQAFALPHAAYFNPSVFGSLEGLNGVAWAVGRALFDLKFQGLFSLLFGASLALAGPSGSARRRLFVLVVFGLLHGYLLFVGDILFTYGIVGLAVLPLLTRSVRQQAVVGAVLLAMAPLLAAVGAAAFDALPAFVLDDVAANYGPGTVARDLLTFRQGYAAQLPLRAELAFSNHVTGTLLDAGWRGAGWMLIGMAAARGRAFSTNAPSVSRAAAALVVGLVVTIGGIAVQLRTGFAFRPWLGAQALHNLGAIGVVIGFAVLGTRAANRFAALRVVEALGRLGRVAFSAYILQSLWGMFTFGGQGLGLFGQLPRTALVGLACAVWTLQLALAWWWTDRFRFGPLEAVWRGLYQGTGFTLGRLSPSARPSA